MTTWWSIISPKMKVKGPLSFSHSANNQFCNLVQLLHLSGSGFLRVKKTCWYISPCFLFIAKSTAFNLQWVWYPKRPEIIFPMRWGGLFGESGTLRCGFGSEHSTLRDISPLLFSAQTSPAWGHLLWRREFQMPTWKGKRTRECWNTSDYRYWHLDQKQSWSHDRQRAPAILLANVWDIQCHLAQCRHDGSINGWTRVPPSVQGKYPSLLDSQPPL